MGYIMDLRELIGNKPIIMAGAAILVINEENEILLQHRTDNDSWGFIGGSMELGETFENTAKREAFEEAGIVIDEMELFNIYSGIEMYNRYPNGDEVYNVVALFRAIKYKGEITPDGIESKDLRFFSLNNIPNKINPPDVHIINDIKNKYKGIK